MPIETPLLSLLIGIADFEISEAINLTSTKLLIEEI
jgi:hypothetical protein